MKALEACWWPQARLGEAIDLLAVAAGGTTAAPAGAPATPESPDEDWIAWAASRSGAEAVAVDAAVADLAATLRRAAPALVACSHGDARGFFVVIGTRRRDLIMLDPALSRMSLGAATLATALSEPLAAPLRPSIDRLVDLSGVSPDRRGAVADALLKERLAACRIAGITLLRQPLSSPMVGQARREGLWALLLAILGGAALLYALEIAGWRLIGEGLFAGRVDRGWLTAWALLLVTLVALRAAVGWSEARLAIGLGRLLKARLLAGALALRPDVLRRGGAGQVIGKVIEAQALESLAFDGGLGVLTSVIELALAAWVLGQGAAPGSHLALLAGWIALTGWLGGRYARRLARWSDARLALTNELVEAMVGHRTRLAQEPPDRRAAHDDAALSAYLDLSRRMDAAGFAGINVIPALWLPLGVAALLPALLGTVPAVTALAISLGGLLLAQRGFAGIAGGLAGLARARIAWTRVRDLLATAPADAAIAATPATAAVATRTGPLIDAEGLAFAWPGGERRIIDGADLSIAHGDRILLEGRSGGGKSTLAALLAGLERPATGLLLLDGLDRATLGDAWHRHATAAPQFHDNHILSATLAFNLLMGRRWPPTAEDLRAAETMCEDLGLGDLLQRMPGGLEQRVGETGWQLSHGERGRVFLARALLQGADFTIVDEGFAALDPANLRAALATTRAHAATLMVIAHP